MGGFGAERSGVHWCRRRVRFNEVPEKVPEKVWEALVQSQVRSHRVPEKVPEKVWEALVESEVRFKRVPENVPEKVWEALVQSQVRFNRVPEKVPGGFGAERGQVQQGSGEGSGEGVARYHRVLEKVPEKRWPGDSIFVESELHNFKSLSGEAQRLGFWRSLQSHINLLICKFFLSRHAPARMQGERWSGALAFMVGIDYPGKKNQ